MIFKSFFPQMFDQNARLNEASGQPCYMEFVEAVGPIFKRWIEKGYNPREVNSICHMASLDFELEGVLDLEHIRTSPDALPNQTLKDTRPKIAIDHDIPNRACRFLLNNNLMIPVKRTGQDDDQWVERAKMLECSIVISNDPTVRKLALASGMVVTHHDKADGSGAELLDRIMCLLESRR